MSLPTAVFALLCKVKRHRTRTRPLTQAELEQRRAAARGRRRTGVEQARGRLPGAGKQTRLPRVPEPRVPQERQLAEAIRSIAPEGSRWERPQRGHGYTTVIGGKEITVRPRARRAKSWEQGGRRKYDYGSGPDAPSRPSAGAAVRDALRSAGIKPVSLSDELRGKRTESVDRVERPKALPEPVKAPRKPKAKASDGVVRGDGDGTMISFERKGSEIVGVKLVAEGITSRKATNLARKLGLSYDSYLRFTDQDAAVKYIASELASTDVVRGVKVRYRALPGGTPTLADPEPYERRARKLLASLS